MPDVLPEPSTPTPESSARSTLLYGTELTLRDGNLWTLADFVPALGDVWDRLYDHNLLAGRYQLPDVQLGAVRLLLAYYDLPAEFAAWLIAKTDPDALVMAIEAAMFGVRNELRTWSDWVDSALRSNGIDPATVPPPRLRPLLTQLVATRRAIPHDSYTSAGIAAGKRAGMQAKFAREGITPTLPSGSTETESSPEHEGLFVGSEP